MPPQKPKIAGTVTFEYPNTTYFLSKRQAVSSPLHSHTFFEMELILSGTGETVLNGITHPLLPGTVYVTLPTDLHSLSAQNGSSFSIWNISFMDTALPAALTDRLIYNTRENLTQLDEVTLHDVCTLYNRILSEQQNPAENSETVASLCLETIFTLLIRQMSPPEAEPNEHSILEAIRFMHQHFLEPISQNEVARHIGLSTPYFSALFREKTGCGYKDYLIKLRLSYASKRMRLFGISATNACYEAGFNSYSSFSKAFQRIYGSSPGKYLPR